MPDSVLGLVTPVVATYQRAAMRGRKNMEAIKLRLANVKAQNLMVLLTTYCNTRTVEMKKMLLCFKFTKQRHFEHAEVLESFAEAN